MNIIGVESQAYGENDVVNGIPQSPWTLFNSLVVQLVSKISSTYMGYIYAYCTYYSDKNYLGYAHTYQ